MQPLKDTEVKLGDQVYPLKFRLSDCKRLAEDHKIDLFEKATVKGFEAIERVALIVHAGIRHAAPQVEYEFVLDSMELTELPCYIAAVVAAQKKVSPEAQKALASLAKLQAKEDDKPSVQ